MEYEDQLREWFDEFSEKSLNFEECPKKYHTAKQVSAIIFLASKLKDKTERFFLHGEHDTLYIGSSFDVFEPFTKDDVEISVYHGINISEDGDGFQMYASM